MGPKIFQPPDTCVSFSGIDATFHLWYWLGGAPRSYFSEKCMGLTENVWVLPRSQRQDHTYRFVCEAAYGVAYLPKTEVGPTTDPPPPRPPAYRARADTQNVWVLLLGPQYLDVGLPIYGMSVATKRGPVPSPWISLLTPGGFSRIEIHDPHTKNVCEPFLYLV